MSKSKDVFIMDVTVRDGSYLIGYNYKPEQVGTIAGILDSAGIDYIEVSHGCGLGASDNPAFKAAASDVDYVRAAKAAVKKAKVGVIAGPHPFTNEKHIDEVLDDIDFIRFAANVDQPETLQKNIDYVRSKRPTLPIFIQVMRSSRVGIKDVVSAFKKADAMGAEVIYLVDTNSFFLPEDVSATIRAVKDEAGAHIGFHAHNSLSLALANTLAAISAGATYVDASIKGVGRAAGNVQLEALVSILHRKNLRKEISLQPLLEDGASIVGEILPMNKGADSIDIQTATANIDLYPIDVYKLFCNAAGVKLRDFIGKLGSYDELIEPSTKLIKRALNDLGADADEVFKSLGI